MGAIIGLLSPLILCFGICIGFYLLMEHNHNEQQMREINQFRRYREKE